MRSVLYSVYDYESSIVDGTGRYQKLAIVKCIMMAHNDIYAIWLIYVKCYHAICVSCDTASTSAGVHTANVFHFSSRD